MPQKEKEETKRRRKKASGVTIKDLIKVTIIPVGGSAKDINLKKDSTVEEALSACGMSIDGETEVRCNGDILERDEIVEDGDQLVILSEGKIEGGSR